MREYELAPDFGRAAELISAAMATGQRSDRVLSVAQEVAEADTHPAVQRIASSVIQGDEERAKAVLAVEPVDSRKRISHLKKVVQREPRNVVRWVDLAREYMVLGQLERAESAMRVARFLAPDDRFVLRASSVMYVQLAEYDQAVSVLRGSGATEHDPWLMAALLAVTDLGDMKVRGVARAIKVAEDGDFPPMHVAELASALGTIESGSGSDRRARRLIRLSLEAPTDNALAQAEWLSVPQLRSRVEEVRDSVPRPFEAKARRAGHDFLWSDAALSARCWLLDQPFSREAALCGSGWANAAEDWSLSEELATAGLEANPDDAGLLNSLAFSRIEAGDVNGAIPFLVRARSAEASRNERAILTATEGLALFRVGLVELGRHRYKFAIDLFSRTQQRELMTHAILMLAREELIVGTEESRKDWETANRLVAESHSRYLENLLDRCRKAAATRGKSRRLRVADTRGQKAMTPILEDSEIRV